MSKLDTYVENIQLKSNKVDADSPSPDWTAEQYPSARALYEAFDKVHPVGSIMCMAENINPADVLCHGTWELFDKELSSKWIQFYEGSGWSNINGYLSTDDSSTSAAYIAGHSLTIRLLALLRNPMSGDDSVELGIINPNYLGITELPMDKIGIPFTIDGGEVVGNATILRDGTIKINDGWHLKKVDNNLTFEHAIDIDYHIPMHVTYTVPYTKMLDSFCDKFYFKRTA